MSEPTLPGGAAPICDRPHIPNIFPSGAQTFSSTIEMPWPTPMHMVQRA
jgi:hypothetical protein